MAGEEDVLLVVTVTTVLGVLGIIGAYSARYKKVPPNHAMVVYGRHFPGGDAYRVLTGGGRFITPIIESFALISLEAMDVNLLVDDVVAKVRAPEGEARRYQVSVTAVARVSDDPELLKRSASTLLNKSGDEIKRMVETTIEGHLRGILAGEATPEADPGATAEQVQRAAAADLSTMGVEVRSLFLKVRGADRDSTKDSHLLDPIRREVHDLDLRIGRIEEKLGLRSSGSRP